MSEALGESDARRLIAEAVDQVGGARVIVGSPRHPFGVNNSETVEVEGEHVTILYGEMSSPAIAMIGGWTFEIKETGLVLLDRPRT